MPGLEKHLLPGKCFFDWRIMGQGTIPSDWEGGFCCWSVLWPDSPQWNAVLRGVLTLPAQGRFWDEHTGIITEAQAVVEQTFDNNLHLTEVFMSCSDGTNSGLQAIANAIVQLSIANASGGASGGCGCSVEVVTNVNGGYQGSVTPPVGGVPVPMYGTVPPVSIPFGEIPEGFADKEEWDLTRCQVANGLIDGAIATLRAWGAINFGQTIGLAGLVVAAAVGLITLGPLMIPLLLAALLVMVGVTGIFITTADDMEANRDDWICAMMQGQNAEGVIGLLSDIMDVLIAGLSVTTVVGAAIKTVLLVLFSTDNVNKLMQDIAHYQYPEADCSGCLCPLFSPDAASGPKEATVILAETLTSVDAGGGDYTDRDRFDVGVTVNGNAFGSWCGADLQIVSWELLSGSVESGASATAAWQVYDNEGNEVYNDSVPPELPLCGAYLATISAVANTWRATFEECPE